MADLIYKQEAYDIISAAILIYFEACPNQEDALSREKYLKTTYGKRFLKNRLKHFLSAENIT